MDRRLSLIVNPAAGRGRAERVLPEVEAALRAQPGLSYEVHRTTGLEHAAELAQAAQRDGAVAATLGGDGLVGAVAGALRGSDGVLGVLPGGRGNDFARVLGLPPDPAEACATLVSGRVRELDIGEVDGRPFIGIASCGFDSDANRIANEARLLKGDLVYVYGALRALAAWRPARFELELDGRTRVFTGWSVAAANSKAYGGGMYVAPNAELDDGMLDVVLSEETSKLNFLRVLPKVYKGRHIEEPGVHVERARELKVSADRPFTMYADGDPIGELPVTVRINAGALRVLVPV